MHEQRARARVLSDLLILDAPYKQAASKKTYLCESKLFSMNDAESILSDCRRGDVSSSIRFDAVLFFGWIFRLETVSSRARTRPKQTGT
jgi:hypothetical protein